MHIVLVDPSRTVLISVGRLLEARDHHVHPFVDGRAALDFLQANRQVDALITSAVLRPMSGLELCWEARLVASFDRPLYVILMSSSNDRHGLSESEAFGWVQKRAMQDRRTMRAVADDVISGDLSPEG